MKAVQNSTESRFVKLPTPSRHLYSTEIPEHSELRITAENPDEDLCVSKQNDGSVIVWTRKKAKASR